MKNFKKATRLSYALILALLRSLKVLLCARFFCRDIYLKAWFGDLGNNLIQLANAEYLSKMMGLNIHPPCHSFLEVEKQYIIHEIFSEDSLEDANPLNYVWYLDHLQSKIKLSQLPGKQEFSLFRYFFYGYDTLPFLPSLRDYRQIFKNKISPLIPHRADSSVTDETLVIHMRSGDVFGDASHQAYVQPPLSFYLEIIETLNFKDIIIVTQRDFRNPCIHELQRLIPGVRIQASSLIDDVSTILSARNLVTGMSTFSISLGFASDQIKRLYVPQFELKQGYLRPKFWPGIFKLVLINNDLDFKRQPVDFDLYPIKILSYIPIGAWHNKSSQWDLMLSHSRENIRLDPMTFSN